jgi:hypothetical protein
MFSWWFSSTTAEPFLGYRIIEKARLADVAVKEIVRKQFAERTHLSHLSDLFA